MPNALELRLDVDALAALREDNRYRTRKADRPRRLSVDDSGETLNLTLPAPAAVARAVDLPGRDVVRRGPALLTRPAGSQDVAAPLDLAEVADSILGALATLPPVEISGGHHLPYPALCLVGRLDSPAVGAYLLDVARAYRDSRPAAPAAAPRPKVPRGPAVSDAERKRAQRQQQHDDERATVHAFLDDWLGMEHDPPLGRWHLSTVYDVMEEFAEVELDELPSGRHPRVPARRSPRFLEPLAERLGARLHTRTGTAIEVRPEHLTRSTQSVGDLAARGVLSDVRAQIEGERTT